jgi:hypothetical protein
MRIILTIILFVTLQAQGQQLFHAHNKVSAPAGFACGVADSDACAFITEVHDEGVDLNSTQKAAIQTLVTDLKSAGLWTKMHAIYPFVGATGEAHSVNLKNPSLYKTSVMFGAYYSANGTDFPGSDYVNTGLVPSAVLPLASQHLSFYGRETGASGVMMGADATTVNGSGQRSRSILAPNYSGGNDAYSGINNNGDQAQTGASSQGYHVVSLEGGTTRTYRNGAQLSSWAWTGTDNVDMSILIGARAGAPQFTSIQCAFATIGEGLSPSEVSSLNTIVEAFQDALSRGIQ